MALYTQHKHHKVDTRWTLLLQGIPNCLLSDPNPISALFPSEGCISSKSILCCIPLSMRGSSVPVGQHLRNTLPIRSATNQVLFPQNSTFVVHAKLIGGKIVVK